MFVNLRVNNKLYKLIKYNVPMHMFLHICWPLNWWGKKDIWEMEEM